MAYRITENCAACGACTGVCPVNAISDGTPYHIDADTCVSCGTCSDTCPMGAIVEE